MSKTLPLATKNLFGITPSSLKSKLIFRQDNEKVGELYREYQRFQKYQNEMQQQQQHKRRDLSGHSEDESGKDSSSGASSRGDNIDAATSRKEQYPRNPLGKHLRIVYHDGSDSKVASSRRTRKTLDSSAAGTTTRRPSIRKTPSTPYFSLDMPAYRYNQISQNLYKNFRTNLKNLHSMKPDIHQWTNLPAQLREILESEYHVNWGEVVHTDASQKDLTQKFLTKMDDGEKVESVIIPASSVMPSDLADSSSEANQEQYNESTLLDSQSNEEMFDSDYAPVNSRDATSKEHQATLCFSSQVGCSMQCSFCATGTQQMKRNLTAGEIVGQYLNGQKLATRSNLTISRLVAMGMGEPLYNYRNLKDALSILMDEFGFSGHKIIVSTCGVVPAMHKLTKELNVNLAVSLHATNNALRDKIVPVNRMFPLEELMAACKDYEQNNGKRLSFEYVMLEDVNDSYEDAKSLVALLKDLRCSVNLIPFNPWPGSPYKTSPKSRIIKFSQYLYYHKIPAPIRWSRGDDVAAACGQLKSDEALKTNFLDTHPLYPKKQAEKEQVL